MEKVSPQCLQSLPRKFSPSSFTVFSVFSKKETFHHLDDIITSRVQWHGLNHSMVSVCISMIAVFGVWICANELTSQTGLYIVSVDLPE